MILHIYTIIHTLISLIAIFTGFVALFGLLAASVSSPITLELPGQSPREGEGTLEYFELNRAVTDLMDGRIMQNAPYAAAIDGFKGHAC
jgi:hypothetical protein